MLLKKTGFIVALTVAVGLIVMAYSTGQVNALSSEVSIDDQNYDEVCSVMTVSAESGNLSSALEPEARVRIETQTGVDVDFNEHDVCWSERVCVKWTKVNVNPPSKPPNMQWVCDEYKTVWTCN